MHQTRVGLWMALLFPIFGLLPMQQPEPELIAVSGRLFVDLDADGLYDEGEPALGGIAIEFANGEHILTVATAEDGTFSFEVEPGLWRAVLRPPEGFEYALPQGIELQVLQAGGDQLSLNIGLQPVQLLQVLVEALETGDDGGEPAPEPVEDSPEQPEPADPEVEPEIYDGPFLPPDESLDPSLLPESGARLPPRMLLIGAALGLLTVGALSWAAGRLLQRRPDGAAGS